MFRLINTKSQKLNRFVKYMVLAIEVSFIRPVSRSGESCMLRFRKRYFTVENARVEPTGRVPASSAPCVARKSVGVGRGGISMISRCANDGLRTPARNGHSGLRARREIREALPCRADAAEIRQNFPIDMITRPPPTPYPVAGRGACTDPRTAVHRPNSRTAPTARLCTPAAVEFVPSPGRDNDNN